MEINENKINNIENGNKEKELDNKKEKTEEAIKKQKELTPEEDLEEFLAQNDKVYRTVFKMLKIGIPITIVEQKAAKNEVNMDLFYILVEKAKKIYPDSIEIFII